jgi:spore coat protein U-like protein
MTRRLLHAVVLCVVVLLWPGRAEAQSCTYSVDPVLSFGSVMGVPTPQIDVAATISVTCTGPVIGVLPTRVCLSIPAGSGGLSIADRRLASGASFVQYQLFGDAGRTQVWGALGGSSPPVTVDFPALSGTATQVVSVYGRVFAGQTGKPIGTYTSTLTPIQARAATYLLVLPPSCTTLNSAPTTIGPMQVNLAINPSCTISANPLSFGTVTGLSGQTASTNLSATCTLNAPYSIALDGGSVAGDVNARRMRLGPGPDTIDYQLYRDSARTLVWGDTTGTRVTGVGTGSTQSIPVFGLVPTQGPRPPGVYADTITVTIVF